MAMSPRLLRPRAGGGFNPKSIAGLAFWLDAGVSSAITFNGSTISQINDRSGNGRNATQAVAARQPTYSATAANGRPAIEFNGTNLLTSEWAFTNTVTVFAVARNIGNSFAGYFQRGSAVNDRHAGYRNSSAIWARRGSGNETSIAHTSTAHDIIQWSFTASLSRVFLNGVQSADNTSSASFAADARALRVGALSDGSFNMNGSIAEFLYYDATLTAAEASAVRRYLGQKYNIATT